MRLVLYSVVSFSLSLSVFLSFCLSVSLLWVCVHILIYVTSCCMKLLLQRIM